MSRYVVINESQTAHCCFVATVVDITKRAFDGSEQFEPVCECFEEEYAIRIASALNKAEEAL